MLWMGDAYFKTRAPGCAYNFFELNRVTSFAREIHRVIHHHGVLVQQQYTIGCRRLVPELVSIAIPGTLYQTSHTTYCCM